MSAANFFEFSEVQVIQPSPTVPYPSGQNYQKKNSLKERVFVNLALKIVLPPIKNNDQLFFGVAKDYVMCVT